MADFGRDLLAGDLIALTILFLATLPFVLVVIAISMLVRNARKTATGSPTQSANTVRSDAVEEIQKLSALNDGGAITDDEFTALKSRVLGSDPTSEPKRSNWAAWALLVLAVVAVGIAAVLGVDHFANSPADMADHLDERSPATTAPATTAPTPPTTIALPTTAAQPEMSADAGQVLAWITSNQDKVQPFGTAQQAFQGAIAQQASDDVVGYASIDLYNALIELPPMPVRLPTSALWNTWLTTATASADQTSDGYLNGDIELMYRGLAAWIDADRMYAEWLETAGTL